MSKREIKITVLDSEQYDNAWPFEYDGLAIGEFMAWVETILRQIPENHRHTARIEVSSVGGYEGDHYASIAIYYTRIETDAEYQDRLQIEQEREQRQEAAERETLRKLQEKYGETP